MSYLGNVLFTHLVFLLYFWTLGQVCIDWELFKILVHFLTEHSIFLFSFCGIPGATLEGSSMGHLSLPYSEEPAAFPHIVRLSDVKVSHEGHAVISRKKRNILFPSGVKLCAQETAPQVVANHLSYFHLRGETQTLNKSSYLYIQYLDT